jgi:hypothetical protein
MLTRTFALPGQPLFVRGLIPCPVACVETSRTMRAQAEPGIGIQCSCELLDSNTLDFRTPMSDK